MWIVGIILALLILFHSNLNLPFAIGSSTLSLSQVDLQSSNSYLNGQAWLLTFTSGGLGQTYFGSFSPNQIVDGNQKATDGFTMNVDYSDTTCNYDITSVSSFMPIYNLQKVEWTYIPLVNPCTVEEANSRGLGQVVYVKQFNSELKCVSIGYNEYTAIGSLSNPDVESEFTITINTKDGQASRTFNTLESRQGSIGSFAYGIWQGNLVSGQQCDDQSDYRAGYKNGQWRIINRNQYEQYLQAYNLNNLNNYNQINDVNSWYNNVVSKANSVGSVSFGSIQNSASVNNAQVILTTQTPIQFPVASLYIKADTLGIYTPTPDFSISNQNSECFKTGSGNGLITFTLTNNGESGTYNAYAQCNSPFSTSGTVTGSLSKGQSRVINLPITASASQKETSSCTIYVESTGQTKTQNVGVCVDPLITCTLPYPQKFCSSDQGKDVVKQCSQDGATSNILEVCDVGKTCIQGECVEGTNIVECKWYDLGCQTNKLITFISGIFNGAMNIYDILKLGASILVLIFSFLFGKDLFDGFKGIRKYPWIGWILSIIVALVLAYVTYKAFFIGLIVFVIWIIFKIVVGGQLFAFKQGVRRLRK